MAQNLEDCCRRIQFPNELDTERKRAIDQEWWWCGIDLGSDVTSYGLRDECQKIHDTHIPQIRADINDWAGEKELAVEEEQDLMPTTLRLKPGTIIWPESDRTSYFIPIFAEKSEMVLVEKPKNLVCGEERPASREQTIDWQPKWTLHLHEVGIKIREGSIMFIYGLLKLGPVRT